MYLKIFKNSRIDKWNSKWKKYSQFFSRILRACDKKTLEDFLTVYQSWVAIWKIPEHFSSSLKHCFVIRMYIQINSDITECGGRWRQDRWNRSPRELSFRLTYSRIIGPFSPLLKTKRIRGRQDFIREYQTIHWHSWLFFHSRTFE